MSDPIDTIREALDRWAQGYHVQIADMPLIGRARAALTELEQQLAAAKVREDRLALGVVTKSNELARAEADRDRLQGMLTARTFSTTESGAAYIQELEARVEAAETKLEQAEGAAPAEPQESIKLVISAYGQAITQLRADRARLADTLREIVDGLDHEGLGVVPHQAYIAARAALDRQEQT